MIRVVLLALVGLFAFVVLNWFTALIRSSRKGGGELDGAPGRGLPIAGESMVQDPVCRIYLPKSSAIVRHIEGADRYFCSDECAERFHVEEVVHGQ